MWKDFLLNIEPHLDGLFGGVSDLRKLQHGYLIVCGTNYSPRGAFFRLVSSLLLSVHYMRICHVRYRYLVLLSLFQGVFLSGSGEEIRSMDAGKRRSVLVVVLAGKGAVGRWWHKHACGWVVSSWIGFKFRIAVMGRSGKFCWRCGGLQMDLGGLRWFVSSVLFHGPLL
ncbi:hypothetical protein PSPO01_01291 [Paraphaeosphaeria sporulosa]